MNKTELVAAMAEKAGLTKKDAEAALAAFVSVVADELKKIDDGIKIIENEKNNLKNSADFYFACGIFYMQAVLSDVQKYLNYFLEIENSYLKCLEIGENKNSDGVIGCGSFKASYNLGVFYEVTGNSAKAREYYGLAGRQGYAPARERLKNLNK